MVADLAAAFPHTGRFPFLRHASYFHLLRLVLRTQSRSVTDGTRVCDPQQLRQQRGFRSVGGVFTLGRAATHRVALRSNAGLNDFAPLKQPCYVCGVNAATALEKQIERYRQMTGEQRLKIALDLHEMSCDIAREGIRHQNANADEAEIERLLHERLALANSEKQIAELAIATKLA